MTPEPNDVSQVIFAITQDSLRSFLQECRDQFPGSSWPDPQEFDQPELERLVEYFQQRMHETQFVTVALLKTLRLALYDYRGQRPALEGAPSLIAMADAVHHARDALAPRGADPEQILRGAFAMLKEAYPSWDLAWNDDDFNASIHGKFQILLGDETGIPESEH